MRRMTFLSSVSTELGKAVVEDLMKVIRSRFQKIWIRIQVLCLPLTSLSLSLWHREAYAQQSCDTNTLLIFISVLAYSTFRLQQFLFPRLYEADYPFFPCFSSYRWNLALKHQPTLSGGNALDPKFSNEGPLGEPGIHTIELFNTPTMPRTVKNPNSLVVCRFKRRDPRSSLRCRDCKTPANSLSEQSTLTESEQGLRADFERLKKSIPERKFAWSCIRGRHVRWDPKSCRCSWVV